MNLKYGILSLFLLLFLSAGFCYAEPLSQAERLERYNSLLLILDKQQTSLQILKQELTEQLKQYVALKSLSAERERSLRNSIANLQSLVSEKENSIKLLKNQLTEVSSALTKSETDLKAVEKSLQDSLKRIRREKIRLGLVVGGGALAIGVVAGAVIGYLVRGSP